MKRLTLAAIILLLSTPALAGIDEASIATRSDIFAVNAAGYVRGTSVASYIAPFNTRLSTATAALALHSEVLKQAYIDHNYRNARKLTAPKDVADFYPELLGY